MRAELSTEVFRPRYTPNTVIARAKVAEQMKIMAAAGAAEDGFKKEHGGSAAAAAQVALDIAVRYALQRRQFSGPGDEGEVLIMDYLVHQRRLFPLIARSCMRWSSRKTNWWPSCTTCRPPTARTPRSSANWSRGPRVSRPPTPGMRAPVPVHRAGQGRHAGHQRTLPGPAAVRRNARRRVRRSRTIAVPREMLDPERLN
jgi:hypothetical protein